MLIRGLGVIGLLFGQLSLLHALLELLLGFSVLFFGQLFGLFHLLQSQLLLQLRLLLSLVVVGIGREPAGAAENRRGDTGRGCLGWSGVVRGEQRHRRHRRGPSEKALNGRPKQLVPMAPMPEVSGHSSGWRFFLADG